MLLSHRACNRISSETLPTLRVLLNYKVPTFARIEGYIVVLWTVSADHEGAPTAQEMTRLVLKLVHPGAIVLVHDGCIPSRWKDVQALKLIIEGLQKRGYKFVIFSTLLKRSNSH